MVELSEHEYLMRKTEAALGILVAAERKRQDELRKVTNPNQAAFINAVELATIAAREPPTTGALRALSRLDDATIIITQMMKPNGDTDPVLVAANDYANFLFDTFRRGAFGDAAMRCQSVTAIDQAMAEAVASYMPKETEHVAPIKRKRE